MAGIPPEVATAIVAVAVFTSFTLKTQSSSQRRSGSNGLQERPDGQSLGRRLQP